MKVPLDRLATRDVHAIDARKYISLDRRQISPARQHGFMAETLEQVIELGHNRSVQRP